MTINDIQDWLSMHKDEHIRAIYQKNNPIEVIGIKITDLRLLSKQIGMNQELSERCYSQSIYEMLMLATMICDPAQISLEKMRAWIIQAKQTNIIDQGLVHIMLSDPSRFSHYLLWCEDDNDDLRYGGYAFLSSYFRQAELTDIDIETGVKYLTLIEKTISSETLQIQNAMNNAVVMAGLHVPQLVEKATEVAEKIGYILPLKVKNSCNIQSATDYLIRYQHNPRYSRVARLNQTKG